MTKTVQAKIDCSLSPKPIKPLSSSPCDGQSQHIFFIAAIRQAASAEHPARRTRALKHLPALRYPLYVQKGTALDQDAAIPN